MQAITGTHLNIPQESVAVASTGVIGKQLPMEIIEAGISNIDLEKPEPYAFHEAIWQLTQRQRKSSLLKKSMVSR